MSLITRCPACATAFRVLAEQLSARGGKVRCGKCNEVFDAVSTLVPDDGAGDERVPSPQLALFDPARLAALAEAEQRAAAEKAAREEAAAAARAAEAARARNAPPVRELVPEFFAEPAPRSRFGLVWGLLCLLALAGLLGQAVLHFRNDIALRLPELRPQLELACETLGCRLERPRIRALVAIESVEMLSSPALASQVEMIAVIHNRAPFGQAFPHLLLTLSRESGEVVVRRVFKPREYLRHVLPAQRLADGMRPNAELTLRMTLEVSDQQVSSFKLTHFYPRS